MRASLWCAGAAAISLPGGLARHSLLARRPWRASKSSGRPRQLRPAGCDPSGPARPDGHVRLARPVRPGPGWPTWPRRRGGRDTAAPHGRAYHWWAGQRRRPSGGRGDLAHSRQPAPSGRLPRRTGWPAGGGRPAGQGARPSGHPVRPGRRPRRSMLARLARAASARHRGEFCSHPGAVANVTDVTSSQGPGPGIQGPPALLSGTPPRGAAAGSHAGRARGNCPWTQDGALSPGVPAQVIRKGWQRVAAPAAVPGVPPDPERGPADLKVRMTPGSRFPETELTREHALIRRHGPPALCQDSCHEGTPSCEGMHGESSLTGTLAATRS
jgi:hypothetical protein